MAKKGESREAGVAASPDALEPEAVTENASPVEPEQPPVIVSKPEAYFITAILDDGKRIQVRKECGPAQAQAEAKAITKSGIERDESGAWVYYPASRVVKVSVTPA